MTRQSLQDQLGLKSAENFRKLYLVPALKSGLIEMTRPDKPQSRLQKYRLTVMGRGALTAMKTGGRIRRIGPARGGSWKIVEDDDE